jgi:AFG3 family protein
MWIGLGGLGLALMLGEMGETRREINWNEFKYQLLEQKLVDRLEIVNGTQVNVYLKMNSSLGLGGGIAPSGGQSVSPYYFTVGSTESFERKLQEAQIEFEIPPREAVPLAYHNKTSLGPLLLSFAPTLLLIGAFVMMGRRMGGAGGPGGMFKVGKAKPTVITKETDIAVTFKDVAGLNEAKNEVMELVSFLQRPDSFTKLGAKVPKGALLCGPPGTGKTLLAKAMAGEAGVPFLSMSGSDFIEMFVGVGPARVRDLFEQARAMKPCIVFIDEIDAVGRARGKGGFSGGNDERENTLNQLLVELDGFDTLSGVIVLAGTNRADVLDPALLRPGRFDRQINVDKPDIKGRLEIFHVHLSGLKLKDKVDEIAERMSALTPGFSGADIANVCNEAALIAARKNDDGITLWHFELAIDRVIGGLEKKNKVMSVKEKETVAYHEAGHAVAGWFLEHADPLLKVSIVPRGKAALGYAQYLPKDLALHTKEQLFDMMCMALGGRAAENIFFSTCTNGAADDLDKVTSIAYSAVAQFGMSDKLGLVSFSERSREANQFYKPYSDETGRLIDAEVRELIERAYDRTHQLLLDNKANVEAVAQELLAKEVIVTNDVVRLVGERPFESHTSYKDIVDSSWQRAEGSRMADTPSDQGSDQGEGSSDDSVKPATVHV